MQISDAEGLGLVEAVYLVLVSGVSPEVRDAGIQVEDTVAGVRVRGGASSKEADAGFYESTLAMDLAATAERITAAIEYAEATGKTEIVLELNRLIKLRYTDEKKEEEEK